MFKLLFHLIILNFLIKFETVEAKNDFDCRASPCVHGICLVDSDDTHNFRCMCESGYTGSHCQLNYDECSLNKCQNNASCVDLIADFRCNCLPGFTGTYCETVIDNCAAKPCRNNGICMNRPNDYKCYCPFGFIGRNCETDVNVCSTDHCQNNGTCVEGPGYEYKCQCQPGFTGRNCESIINPCAQSPCENGGRCVSNSYFSYACTCPCDYTGDRCELKTETCTNSNGLNCVNGVCRLVRSASDSSNTTFQPKCFCSPGFTGALCNEHFPVCLQHSNLCENNGQCKATKNGYECTCLEPYAGKHCELNCQLGQCDKSSSLNSDPFSSIESTTPTHETASILSSLSSFYSESLTLTSSMSIDKQFASSLSSLESTNFAPTSIVEVQPESKQMFPVISSDELSTPFLNTISATLPSSDSMPLVTSTSTLIETSSSNWSISDLNSNSTLSITSVNSELKTSTEIFSDSNVDFFTSSTVSTAELSTESLSSLSSNTFTSDQASTFTTAVSSNSIVSTNQPSFVIETSSSNILPSNVTVSTPVSSVTLTTNKASETNQTTPVFSARFRSKRESRLMFYRDPLDAPLYFRLQFEFITNQSDGVLLHVRPQTRTELFAVVFLQNSRLKYAFSCYPNRVVFIQSDLQLKMNAAHRLQIQFKLDVPKKTCFADLSLNDSMPVFASQQVQLTSLDLLCIKLFQFGRLIESNGLLPLLDQITPFDGCLQNIELNGRPRFVHNANISNEVSECNESNVCASSPCRNQGVCESKSKRITNQTLDSSLFTQHFANAPKTSAWQCVCPTGHFGQFCEYSSCKPNPCSQDSTCLLPNMYEYMCLCDKWKFGKDCQNDLRSEKFFFDDNQNSFLIFSFVNNPNFLEIHFNLTLTGSDLTEQPSVLMFMGQNYNQIKPKADFLLLTINSEAITFKINLGKQTKEISTRFIRHELLHEIRFGHSNKHVWLSVDNYDHNEDRLQEDYETLDVQDRLFVGGHRYSDGVEQLQGLKFFSGCVFDVAFKSNKETTDLTPLDKVIYSHNVNPCPDIHCRR